MTERERSDALRDRIIRAAGSVLAEPIAADSFAGLLSDALVELDRLAGIVDDARRAVGSTP